MNNRKRTALCLLGAALCVFMAFGAALALGRYPITPAALLAGDAMAVRTFTVLRLPRAVMALIGGFGLGAAGFVYQTVFRNPLASPDIIGVSSGASVGAAFAILFVSSGALSTTVCAFAGGLAAVFLSLELAAAAPGRSKMSLVLAGIAVHALAQTLLMLLKLTADPEKELASIEYWIMGSLAAVTRSRVWFPVPVVLVCCAAIFALHRQALLLSIEEGEARLLGVRVGAMRLLLLTLATMTVAAVVSVTGLISFVGLLAPHSARLLAGHNRRSACLLSGLLGSALLLAADTLAKTAASTELPVSIFTSLLGFDFGLMKKHERNAAHGDLFTSGGEAFQNQEIKDPTEGGKFAKGKVIDLIAPMIVMIFTAIATMIWTGYLNGGTNLVEDFANCSSSESLVFAGLVTVGFLLLFYLPRRVIGFKDFMNSVPEGGKLMMPPILILVLAWTLKGMTDALGIGDFVRQAVSLNEGLMRFVPLLIFCIAIFIAFSSGTSWGTFAILVPIVVNMFSETDPTMMIVAVSAVLAGAVCGDHISPISDTTIMSSSGAQSNHINHVQTQMQYAMVVVAACVPGYLIAGFTENWLITLVSSLAILTAALLYLRRRSLAEDARA